MAKIMSRVRAQFQTNRSTESSTPRLAKRFRGVAAIVAAVFAIGVVGGAPVAANADPTFSIQGTVADSSGPLETQRVDLYDTAGPSFVDEVLTGADGHYSFDGVAPGEYYVWFIGDNGYQSQIFDGVNTDNFSADGVEPIEVVAANLTGIDALLSLPVDVTVSGTASVSDGTPPDSYTINLDESDGAGGWNSSDSFSSADGTYQFHHVSPGSYRVVFSAGLSFAPDIVEFTVAAVPVGGIDGVISPLPLHAVSGTVYGVSSVLASISVDVWAKNGSDWNIATSTDVNPSGEFSFDLPDGTYRVRYSDLSHTFLSQVFDGTDYHQGVNDSGFDIGSIAGATNIVVSGADVENVNATLHLAPVISGVVSFAGDPVPDVSVTLYGWQGGNFISLGGTSTDAGGHYSLDGLSTPDNDYTIFFNADPADTNGISAYLNGTTTLPVDNTSPGVVHVTGSNTTVNFTLPTGAPISGLVVNSAGGAPLTHATVEAWVWDGVSNWSLVRTTHTSPSGTYSLGVPSGETYTVRASLQGFTSQYLGGGSTQPASPTGSNSFVLAPGGHALTTFSLVPRPTSLGNVAGQNLAYCTLHSLDANDDSSTGEISLPFNLQFFGESYSSLYVNNNGNVTFGAPRGDYTPSDLSANISSAIIAPFFADVDTRSEDSRLVTYGASPDGKTFCVNWADLGYYSEHADKQDTFQLLLKSRTGDAGRASGDFDITFNYDQIEWETGDASNGANGLGGISAAAGYSAGSGDPGTFFQFAGSFTNGALLDGGPNALISGKQNSTQVGRYVFEIRNTGDLTYGALSGHVKDSSNAPIANAFVEIAHGSHTYFTQTNGAGDYAFSAVQTGTYQVTVFPIDDLVGAGVTVNVLAPTVSVPVTIAPDITLRAPVGIESDPNISVGASGGDTNYSDDGVPIVYYGDPFALTLANQCLSATSATYSVTVGGHVHTGTLTEGPAGTYHATVPALYPWHGDGVVGYSITCSNPFESVNSSFDIYLDPSGVVVDQYGAPVAGATVTILRSDSEGGTFVAVPDGSAILSPSNRNNPSLTDSDGRFSWDVAPGWYEVRVALAGSTTVTTNAMEVPPERTELVLTIQRPTAEPPAPTTAPTATGVGVLVGSTVSVTNGTWPSDIVVDGVTWKSGSTIVGTGTNHLVGVGQASNLTAEIALHRVVNGNSDGLSDVPHEFDFPFTYSVSFVPFTTLATPTITGSAKVGSTLTAHPGTWSPAATFSYIWKVAGVVVPSNSAATFVPRAQDVGKKVTVTTVASATGRATNSTRVSKSTAAVAKGTLTGATPTITGTTKVNETLTAVAGSWTSGSVLGYKWYRNGAAISGQSGSTYLTKVADLNKKITVKVTATKLGFNSLTKTSSAKKITVGVLTTTPIPTISGSGSVGALLTALPGTWQPAPVTITYQWYIGSVKVSGATHGTFTVPAAALGKAITLKVTGKKTGFTSITQTSLPLAIP
jgi:Nidogen-like/Carboxypeptidase regulatory-like domain